MTRHLDPEQFVDALELGTGTLDASVAEHLRECAQCQAELAGIRETATAAREVEAFEPSPLFWDHFSARVARATQQARPEPWWTRIWRPALAAGAAAALLWLGMLMKPMSPLTPAPVANPLASSQPLFDSAKLPDDDGSWNLMLMLAAEFDVSDVSQAAAPAEGTADAMIEDLTPAQRDALARLLEKGIGDL